MSAKPAIYCDYNAGSPLRAEAAVAMSRACALGGNPSSVHSFGRRARALVEDAREQIAGLLDARAENLVFTSGATEALHLALDVFAAFFRQTVDARPRDTREHDEGDVQVKLEPSLIIAECEHDALFEQGKHRAMLRAPLQRDGVVDLGVLQRVVEAAPKPALVAVQLANNETGVIQPIAKVAALCREHGVLLLVDAAQAFGRMAVSIADLDASYLIVSSYKIGGPPGAGALVLAPGAPFVSARFGGGQERGRRPGTENMPAIVGFSIAAEWAVREMPVESRRLAALRDRFEAGLPKDAVVFGGIQRLPNTSNFALPGMNAEAAVIAMDLEGVAISSGAACSSGKVKSSRVLAAMGVAPELAKCALRVSFGHESKESDVDAALAALSRIGARRRVLEGAAS